MSEARQPDTLDEMRARVEALQTPLGQLVDLATHVRRTFRPQAPHLRNAASDAEMFYIASDNRYGGKPMSDTLTIRIDEGEHIDIEEYNGPSVNQPVLRIDHWLPYEPTEEGQPQLQRTRIQKFGEVSTGSFQLDIQVSTYVDHGRFHSGFVGEPYQNQEPHIGALEDRLLALVVPDDSGQI